jgi:hypothetical protein
MTEPHNLVAHNHLPDPVAEGVSKIRHAMRLRAQQTDETPSVIIAKELQGVPESIRLAIPSVTTCKRTIQRQRQRELGARKELASLHFFSLDMA